jgi:hypothetical protein
MMGAGPRSVTMGKKDKCCDRYKKKDKYCSGCPIVDSCELAPRPEEEAGKKARKGKKKEAKEKKEKREKKEKKEKKVKEDRKAGREKKDKKDKKGRKEK